MLNPADVVEALGSTNSRLEKEKILQQAWDNGILEFFQGTQLALDALVTFGIARAPLIEEGDDGGSFGWQEFSALAQRLQRRELTGNSARDEIRSAAERAPARLWNLWYRRLLLKDLKVGVTEATINKVLAANGAEGKKYLVPVFSCQLAKPAEDHPKKMRGRKLLDRKYDGCLSASWTIEFEDGRKLTIGEVVKNKIEGRIKSYNTRTKKIEFNEIEAWATNHNMTNDQPVRWFKLKLENGVTMPPITGNHLIWMPLLNCWRRVDELRIGDKILYK